MGKLFALAVVILDIVAIVDLIKSGKDTMRKVLWIAVIIFLPLIGLILYFLAGKK